MAADTVYRGGPILTMDGDRPSYVETVAVLDGTIIYAGPASGLAEHTGPATRTRNLGGKAMLPGFIDPHGHFMFALNMINQVNVAGPPVGPANNINSLIRALKDWQAEARVPEGDWIVGWGYDQTLLKEGRHITREDLDPHFPKHKVMLIHVSAHGAVLNSPALAWAGITADTPTPPGGIINRLPDSQEPAGLLMETAYLPLLEKMPRPGEEKMLDLLEPAQMMYASAGYVHAQEGFTHIEDMAFLRKAAQHHLIVPLKTPQGRFEHVDALPEFPPQ